MTFRLAHITDLHLTGSEDERPLLESIFISCQEYDVDHIVVTGDISENGEARAFRMFDEVRREYGFGPKNSTVLIGNHDIPGRRAFSSRFGGNQLTVRDLDGGNLCIVGLDSALVEPGISAPAHSPYGYLDQSQLAELDNVLSGYNGRNVVVALHHHVFKAPDSDATWYMRYGAKVPHRFFRLWGPLDNAGDLLEVLGSHGVQLVLTGHSHTNRERTISRGGTTIQCVIGGSTIQPADPKDDDDVGSAYDYGIFDFRDGVLVSEGRVEICDTCWEAGAVECNDCEGDCELECDTCDGGGWLECSCDADGEVDCPVCGTNGKVLCGHCNGGGCGHCNNTGNRPCSFCAASGYGICGDCNGTHAVPCDDCGQTGVQECGTCEGEGELICDNH